MRARARSASVTLAMCATCVACAAPPPAAPIPEVESVDLSRAGDGPIAGTIDGDDFTAADVRFRVVSFEGRERIDLMIADRRIERCGLPMVRPETLVWARFPGRTALEVGTFESTVESTLGSGDDSALEVHYERPDGRAVRAAHRGVARIEITRASATSVSGRLRICFADDARSCVGGTFEATRCLSRIDGRAAREPPGLVDEALEPPRARGAVE